MWDGFEELKLIMLCEGHRGKCRMPVVAAAIPSPRGDTNVRGFYRSGCDTEVRAVRHIAVSLLQVIVSRSHTSGG
jgi:hypothetical protein